jgi:hypothetical protein
MIDEEDNTVRFIHHSARSFCLNSPRNGAQWTFAKKQADENMAETLVTYLNYNVFETRLSNYRVPNIDVNDIPKRVALSAVRKHYIGASFAERLLKPRSLVRHNVGSVLAEADAYRKKEEHQQFSLLPYASKHWIQHTAHLDELSSIPQWYHLLIHPTFGVDLDDVSVPAGMRSGIHTPKGHPKASRFMIWALQHGHILLLKHELVAPWGARRIQAYVALWLYLRHIEPMTIQKTMEYHLVEWLCQMFLRLRMHHPAKLHLLSRLSILDDNYVDFIREAMASRDMEAIATLLLHDNLSQSNISPIVPRLMELAVSYGQTRILRPLIRNGFASDSQINTINIIRVVASDMLDPVILRFVKLFLQAGIDVSVLRDNEIYIAIKLLCSYSGPPSVARKISGRLLSDDITATSSCRKDILLHRACLRGDKEVAVFLLKESSDPNTRTEEGSCLDATLYAISPGRLSLVWSLLEHGAKPGYATVVRSIQLKQFALAIYLLLASAAFDKYSRIPVPYFQYPLLFVNTFDDVNDLQSLTWPFDLAPWNSLNGYLPRGAPLAQLPILHSSSWLDWQFFFGPTFSYDTKWRVATSNEMELLVHQIHEELPLISPSVQKVQVGQPSSLFLEGSPCISQSWVQYVHFRINAVPWIKVTIPNSSSIITEVSRWWGWLYNEEMWDELESTRVPDIASYAIWKDCGGRDGLGIWELPQSIDKMDKVQALIDQRRRRWALIRSGFAESRWAVRELNKSLVLLQNLPKLSTFIPDGGLPAERLPIWPTLTHGNAGPFGFGFAYLSVRILWLRTLGILLTEQLLNYMDFPDELLEDVGEILGAPADLLGRVTVYRHEIVPQPLEAAFLGPSLSRYLARQLRRNDYWLPDVVTWLEHMDPSIFTWAMGRDSPLSFETAFATFREAGVSKERVRRMQTALEIRRSKVAELM